MRSAGGKSAATATAASTGINRLAVAVFDVISVRNVTERHKPKIISRGFTFVRLPNCSPIRVARPLSRNAAAIQMPPANKSNIPQGMSLAIFQSSSAPPFPLGTRNMTTTARMATVESPAWVMPRRPDQPPKGSMRVIHAMIAIPNTIMVRFSSTRHGPGVGSCGASTPPSRRVSHNPISGTPIATTGTPVIIHRRKE